MSALRAGEHARKQHGGNTDVAAVGADVSVATAAAGATASQGGKATSFDLVCEMSEKLRQQKRLVVLARACPRHAQRVSLFTRLRVRNLTAMRRLGGGAF